MAKIRDGRALDGVMVTVAVIVGVAVAGSGPATGSVGSSVGSCKVGVGPVVGEGSGVQVGRGVGVATGGCKTTMIRLRTMLTAIRPLRIMTTVWLKLRF